MKVLSGVKNTGLYAVYILFALSFSVISIYSFIALFIKDNHKPFITISFTILTAILVFSLAYFIDKYNDKLSKYYYKINAVFCLLYFVALMVFGSLLEFTPAYDMSAIYHSAIELVEQGTMATVNYQTVGTDYFYWFPNNLGTTWFLSLFFYIGKIFSFTNYFLIGTLVNSALICVTIFVSSLICRRLFGNLSAFLALVFYLCMPSLLFSAAAFYTDFLSISFPVITFYIYLRLCGAKTLKSKAILIFALSLSVAIGAMIKFTTIIVFISIVAITLLLKKFKLLGVICLAVIPVLLLSNLIVGTLSAAHLDKERSQAQNTPYIHWIMMGLKNEGRYNGEDYVFTRSFESTQERDRAIIEEIKNRVNNLGVSGLWRLWLIKTNTVFSDGTFGISDFLDDSPKNDLPIHDVVLYSGEHYFLYKAICDGVLLLMIILSVTGAIILLRKKRFDSTLILYLSLIGIMVFLSMWEVSGRYSTNFMPFIVITATLAVRPRKIIKKK